jgi:hypothetical protein
MPDYQRQNIDEIRQQTCTEPPPNIKRKTAGRAVTLRGGAFDSWTAIFTFYGNEESGASTKLRGGAI